MELSKNFEPQAIEAKWYQHWISKGYFSSKPDGREPYTIVIPPPNVTGVLHMGHCLNNTIQDILIRTARMQGKNACWVPGTDHASIATEAKVVAMLREKGITKSQLSREEFLKYAWEWKEKYGGIILQQLKKLGCSLDWDRTAFTMDDDYYKAVIKIFVQLYNDGIIYRGLRMVNWDPASLTALSDEEVIFKEVDSKLYYIKYQLTNEQPSTTNHITVATTRPETILGDVAICVNPSDERYKNFIGKEVIVPIIGRKIPIIADEYVTAEFGTGALKVTPAHDKNDNELGRKHNLKAITTLDAHGKFTADELMDEQPNEQLLSYVGVDRFVLRKKIVEDIDAVGLLQKTEDYKSQVGTSERTGAVIENRLSLQWFVDMKKFIAQNPDVIESVATEKIKFHPAKLKNTYSHWMNNIKDWCISRQLWWGQQIPAWYDKDGNCYVAETEQHAMEIALAKNSKFETRNSKLTQDEDCLDTWFSSWLWPIEVFKGISNPNNADVNYYYPSTTLVTGQDIIFFWVARMIMAGYAFKKDLPFKDVYFTGMVRDNQGRKMSKQLGNSPDLLALIDKYGADATRFGIMIASPAGNDLLFDESSLEQGRNFNNKLWNALKLVKTVWKVGRKVEGSTAYDKTLPALPFYTTDFGNPVTGGDEFSIEWFENRLDEVKQEVYCLVKNFKLSEALKIIYSLIWDDFCSYYLEWVKPNFEEKINPYVFEKTVFYFEELMQLLHPFMPFVTEEIYQLLNKQTADLCTKQTIDNRQLTIEKNILLQGNTLKNVITAIREARAKNQLKPKDEIVLSIETADEFNYALIKEILAKQINAKSISFTKNAIANSIVVAIEKDKFYIESDKEVDTAALKESLLKDLAHQQGFLQSVEKKLSNEKFVANAKPEVLAMEQKKKTDALARIKTIEESLKAIG